MTVDRVIKLSAAGAEYCLLETILEAAVAFGTFRTQNVGTLIAADWARRAATRTDDRRASIVRYESAESKNGSIRFLTPVLGEQRSGDVEELPSRQSNSCAVRDKEFKVPQLNI
jgi:hypothetical protein